MYKVILLVLGLVPESSTTQNVPSLLYPRTCSRIFYYIEFPSFTLPSAPCYSPGKWKAVLGGEG